jgi:hypothetical protein
VEEALERAKADEDPLEGKTLEELDELGEEDEYADSHFLEKYREERLAAMRAAREKAKFGEVRRAWAWRWVRAARAWAWAWAWVCSRRG